MRSLRERRQRRSWRWPGPGTRPSRSSPRWPITGSLTGCTDRSACTSAPRCARRSLTSRCCRNPRDAQAFGRAIASPRRGIGTATITRLVTWARDRHGGDMIAAAAHAGELDRVPNDAARQRLVELGVGLSHVRSELDAERSVGHVVIATVTLAGGLVRHYEHVRDRSAEPLVIHTTSTASSARAATRGTDRPWPSCGRRSGPVT